MTLEKQLEQLLKDMQNKADNVRWTLKSFSNEDKRTNRIARLSKELNAMLRLVQHWHKQAYNIDRMIKENIATALVSSNEDVRKRGQQHHRQKKKKSKK